MNGTLLLGPVVFLDFEVPEQIGFGGAQRLAVHRLPGGGRVIDALGRDDADIGWSGIFSGPDAADRARLLDILRAQGQVLPLTWDAFYYSVVIARFEAQYVHTNWVTYRLVCTVLRDESAALIAPVVDLTGSLLGDLGAAAPAIDVSAAVASLAVSGATSRGTPAYAVATSAVAAGAAGLEATIAASEATLTAASPTTAAAFTQTADAAGVIAAATLARGYVLRASRNLANAST
jgi:hypothetical protein